MSLSTVLGALESREPVRKTGRGWLARCPAHQDKTASLTLGEGGEGRALVKCMAGCRTEAVVQALGLEMGDLFEAAPGDRGGRKTIVATYDYTDEAGVLLFQAVRFSPKDFRQRRPDPIAADRWVWKLEGVRRILYRLPEVLAADKARPVFLPEGEKDVEGLRGLGLVATTNVGGAGKWRAEYSEALRGRHVAILPDNDEPGRKHAHEVARALDGIAAGIRIVELPGLPPKGDVSDWIAAGGTAVQLMALASAADGRCPTGAASVQSFVAAPDRLSGELEDRLEAAEHELTFGVRFLDDALGAITRRDLILLGAKTGTGKTQLATICALANLRAGKRVHMFALEAEEREIERRMKFQILARQYYSGGANRAPIRYLDWYRGKLQAVLGRFEATADEELRQTLRGLFTFYRVADFNSDDFARQLDAVKDSTDLVILDHLHYVDSDDKDTNRGYEATVKRIRDSGLVVGRPVVMVAHVRKGDRRYEPLLPTLEDFHGSGHISKVVTKAIMLAPAFECPTGDPQLWATFMQIAKCRMDSSLTRYAALLTFNARIDSYEPNYQLGKLTENGQAFSPIPEAEWPSWYRGSPSDQATSWRREREPGDDDDDEEWGYDPTSGRRGSVARDSTAI